MELWEHQNNSNKNNLNKRKEKLKAYYTLNDKNILNYFLVGLTKDT